MQSDPLSMTFAALADPTRRAILARLARGQATVTELAEPFDMSLPGVSQHGGRCARKRSACQPRAISSSSRSQVSIARSPPARDRVGIGQSLPDELSRRVEAAFHPCYQRVSTSYLASWRSAVTRVRPSACACATSIRSNGSRWCGGNRLN